MTKQCFGTSHVPLSPAVRAGDFVYVSGQVPVGADGKSVLSLAGCTMEEVSQTHVYVQDARDFGGVNAVYAGYFPKDPPARTTAEARLMIDIKVEIEAIAYKPL